jgi:hypothetical protein
MSEVKMLDLTDDAVGLDLRTVELGRRLMEGGL